MAITYRRSARVTIPDNGNVTVDFDVGTNPTVLGLLIMASDGSPSFMSATIGGVALARRTNHQNLGWKTALWDKLDPSSLSGTQTLSITTTGFFNGATAVGFAIEGLPGEAQVADLDSQGGASGVQYVTLESTDPAMGVAVLHGSDADPVAGMTEDTAETITYFRATGHETTAKTGSRNIGWDSGGNHSVIGILYAGTVIDVGGGRAGMVMGVRGVTLSHEGTIQLPYRRLRSLRMGLRSGALSLSMTAKRQVALVGEGIEQSEMTEGGSEGQVLTQHAGRPPTWEDPTGGGASALDDLTDVDLTTEAPAEGDVLVYRTDEWVPEPPPGAGSVEDLGDLSDVTVTGSETAGQVMTSDGAGGFAFEDPTGGGAPTDAEYIVAASHASLSAEHVVDRGAIVALLQRPAATNAEDDHFDAGSLDGKWLAYTGHDATVSLATLLGWIYASGGGAKLQAVPAGDWTIEGEFIRPNYFTAGYQQHGLILTNGTAAASSTDCRWGLGGDNSLGGLRYTSDKFVNNAYSSTYLNRATRYEIPQHYWLRINKVGTNYRLDYAFGSRRSWTTALLITSLGFTPTHFGLELGAGGFVNYFLRY